MVQRAYPEDAVRRRDIIEIAEPKEVIIEPKEVVRYVYVPSERIQLDPNFALITFGIVVAVGLIALAVIHKK